MRTRCWLLDLAGPGPPSGAAKESKKTITNRLDSRATKSVSGSDGDSRPDESDPHGRQEYRETQVEGRIGAGRTSTDSWQVG